MIRYYLALIDPAADAEFNIVFPDFQGCTASGTTVGDAVTNGAETLLARVEAMEARGIGIPEPSDLEAPPPSWLAPAVKWIRVMVPVLVQNLA